MLFQPWPHHRDRECAARRVFGSFSRAAMQEVSAKLRLRRAPPPEVEPALSSELALTIPVVTGSSGKTRLATGAAENAFPALAASPRSGMHQPEEYSVVGRDPSGRSRQQP